MGSHSGHGERAGASQVVREARDLQKRGQTEQAVAVLKKAVMTNPDDQEILAEYGKSHHRCRQAC